VDSLAQGRRVAQGSAACALSAVASYARLWRPVAQLVDQGEVLMFRRGPRRMSISFQLSAFSDQQSVNSPLSTLDSRLRFVVRRPSSVVRRPWVLVGLGVGLVALMGCGPETPTPTPTPPANVAATITAIMGEHATALAGTALAVGGTATAQ